MTVSGYIAEASRRAALPISVSHDGEDYMIRGNGGTWFPVSEWGAHLSYRCLVNELSNPDALPPSSGRESCSANSSAPEGAGL